MYIDQLIKHFIECEEKATDDVSKSTAHDNLLIAQTMKQLNDTTQAANEEAIKKVNNRIRKVEFRSKGFQKSRSNGIFYA